MISFLYTLYIFIHWKITPSIINSSKMIYKLLHNSRLSIIHYLLIILYIFNISIIKSYSSPLHQQISPSKSFISNNNKQDYDESFTSLRKHNWFNDDQEEEEQTNLTPLLLFFGGSFGMFAWISAFVSIWEDEKKLIYNHKRLILPLRMCNKVNPLNKLQINQSQNKLTYVTGNTQTTKCLKDQLFGISINNCIKLNRIVQVNQWRRRPCTFKDINNQIQYNYYLSWSPINRQQCQQKINHKYYWFTNQQTFYNQNVKLEHYYLSKQQLQKCNKCITYTPTQYQINNINKHFHKITQNLYLNDINRQPFLNDAIKQANINNVNDQSFYINNANNASFAINGVNDRSFAMNDANNQSFAVNDLNNLSFAVSEANNQQIMNNKNINHKAVFMNEWIYFPSPVSNKIDGQGSLRMRYQYCGTGPTTIVAKTIQNSFQTYKLQNIQIYKYYQHDTICQCCSLYDPSRSSYDQVIRINNIKQQKVQMDQMFQYYSISSLIIDKNSKQRIGSYIIIVIGCILISYPISQLINDLYHDGELMSIFLIMVSVLSSLFIAIPITIFLISIVWICYNPKIGLIIIGIILVIIGFILFMHHIHNSHQSQQIINQNNINNIPLVKNAWEQQ